MISVIITTHNSQDFIKDCLKSVAFANEIIVVDNQSTDETVTIAKKLATKVIAYKNNPRKLNESKNFGFTHAKYHWILSLDSDERVDPDLAQELLHIAAQHDHDVIGYQIPRKNIIFGKWIKHGLWYPDHQLRFFQTSKGKFPNKHNHEQLKVDGPVHKLVGHITHLNYHSISQYIQKIDHQYSDNEVDTFLESGQSVKWFDAIRFPFQDFLTNYFARESYKDGLHGLVLSLLQAFYMFIVFCKIWERQGFKPKSISLSASQHEFKRANSQLKYWYIHSQLENAPLLKKIYLKIQNLF